MSYTPPRDYRPGHLPRLDWSAGQVEASLESLHGYATGAANQAIDWYLESKRVKKWGAWATRVGAIAFGTVAAVLPMVAQILKDVSGDGADAWYATFAQPAWAAVALALAGALVVLDRFFGYSSGWMRYIVAELQLRELLDAFLVDWEAERMKWKGAAPDDRQVQAMIGKAREFLLQVDGVVRDETAKWVGEFESVLKQIDEASKRRPGAQRGKP